eukprot:gnl/Dysnectes_brevis/117_a139_4407.p2 GENE.gnl/Dysnectes_brevis/117_a139_4407~~gnl/Dysnectes_brevis/117_a139_4407.p2  ORF type:complete len:137 (+),score=33.50 gnl/Dysnectes_brevis/117_a139_4407:1127-1537(+)
MGKKIIKPGRVCIVLQGRHAGKKCVVVSTHEDGTKSKTFPHALVAGLHSTAGKVTKSMSVKQAMKKSSMRPFIRLVNYQHLMPTRYMFAHNLRADVPAECVVNPTKKGMAMTKVGNLFKQRYMANKDGWFFAKLNF